MLTEETVKVSYQMLGFVRATAVGWDVERNAKRNAVLAGDPK